MKYTVTRNDNGIYRVVIVDETSNPAQHTALECESVFGLSVELGKTLEERELSKTPTQDPA